jgi:hypothetical protein
MLMPLLVTAFLHIVSNTTFQFLHNASHTFEVYPHQGTTQQEAGMGASHPAGCLTCTDTYLMPSRTIRNVPSLPRIFLGC